jgi:eukaryotic-like serine/threonine-protein kinase
LATKTVLHYTLTRPLGSGGMGVVYEADDAKLGRKVALKFLPPELARDKPALDRFQREARAASALNHPNICTIYAIEEANGEYFIAMELLEGESLDCRIAANPPSLDGLLDIGVQVADALDAAHQRGIIHRDIKPANIFVTRDGRAKVLDFGVAKMVSRSDAATALGAGGNEAQLTGPGMAVGTIAYMSPEQARGDDIDARSDLFSLAAVLYEMSTGQPAFKGKTSAVIFQQILSGTPESPRDLNPALPFKVDDVILKGLEKDRDLRYQTAAELRGDLKRLKRDASAGKLTSTMPAAGSAARPISSGSVIAAEVKRRKGLVSVGAIIFAGILTAAIYGVYKVVTQDSTAASRPAATANLDVTRVTTSGQATGCASISPDGKTVAYCDFGGELFAVQVATGSSVSLGRNDGITAFSLDGNYVYSSRITDEHPEGLLLEIPVFGGEPRRIITDITGIPGFSPDGKQMAFLRQFPKEDRVGLMIADATGGNVRQIATSQPGAARFGKAGVAWSADGKWISAAESLWPKEIGMRPVVVDADTGEVHTVDTRSWIDVGRTAWLPNNRLLFAASEGPNSPFQFWIADFPGGAARRVTNETRGFGNYSVGVTADGLTIVTVPWVITANLYETNTDASAPLVQWTSGVREDGETIAVPSQGPVFFESSDGATTSVWSVDRPGARPRQLVQSMAGGVSTPNDGRFVILESLADRQLVVMRVQPDGTDQRRLSKDNEAFAARASPDGRWLYFRTPQGLHRMPADGGAPTQVVKGPVNPLDISLDGKTLLVFDESGQATAGPLATIDAETGQVLAAFDVPGGDRVRFGRATDRLAYLMQDDKGIENLWERSIGGGPARQLTKFTTGRTSNFAYSPDRKRLFLARGTRTGDVTLIRGFK